MTKQELLGMISEGYNLNQNRKMRERDRERKDEGGGERKG